MTVTEIEAAGVWAEPGGWRKLVFTSSGYTAKRRGSTRVLERVFGPWPSSIALGALLLSLPTGYLLSLAGADRLETPVLYVAGLGLLFTVLSGLYHAREEIAAVVWLAGLLALLVATLPLLIWSRYRRWLTDTPFQPRGSIPAGRLVRGQVHYDGDAKTVVVQFTDGTQVRYTASGDDGVRLRQGFARLLGGRLSNPS